MSSNGHLSMCVLPSFPLCTCHPFACEGYITLCVSSFQTFCEFPLQGHGQSQESGGHLWVPHESCLTVRWIPPLQLPATHTQLQPVAGKFISLLCTVTHLPSCHQLLFTLRNKEVRGHRGGSWGIWERARAQWVSQGGKEGHVTQGPRMGMSGVKTLAFRFISPWESARFVPKEPMVNGEFPSSHQERFTCCRENPHVLYLCKFSEGALAFGLSPDMMKKTVIWGGTFPSSGVLYLPVNSSFAGKRCTNIPVWWKRPWKTPWCLPSDISLSDNQIIDSAL